MPFGNSVRLERRSATGLWVGGGGYCHTSQKHYTGQRFPTAKPVADRRSVNTTAQPFGYFRKALPLNQCRDKNHLACVKGDLRSEFV